MLKEINSMRRIPEEKNAVLNALLILEYTKWTCNHWAVVCVTPLCVLYIQHFTLACWESPLPSRGLSRKKPNGCCWRKEKSLISPFPTKILPVRSQHFTHKPVSLIQNTCDWHQMCLVICKYYLIFSKKGETMERRERKSLHLNGNILRGRCDRTAQLSRTQV